MNLVGVLQKVKCVCTGCSKSVVTEKEKNKRSIMERWVKRMSQVVKDEETNLSYK